MASPILRVGLGQCFTRPATLLRSSTIKVFSPSGRNMVVPRFNILTDLGHGQRALSLLLTATGVAGTAFGISSLMSTATLHCDDAPPRLSPSFSPPPKSSVNVYELTFGTACGVCAGMFIKKSARIVAFFLGGLFVMLQYLGSVSLVRVDWAQMGSRFENLFYTTDALGHRRPPTVRSIWKWIVDFLTADFQPRASFVAGFALGLRVG